MLTRINKKLHETLVFILEFGELTPKRLEYIGADKYIWENPEENIWLQNRTGEKEATFYPQPELVICKNYLSQNDTSYHIAYKMDIYAISPLSRDYIYVNAISGEVINIEPRIKTVNANAATRYSGTRTISTELNGSTYRLRDYDNSRGDGIETYNITVIRLNYQIGNSSSV